MSHTKPYTKNQSLGLPEGNTISVKEYREAQKKQSQKNKYNASKAGYNGIVYDSQLEAAYAKELDIRLSLGEIESWERQVKLELKINGKFWRNYKIDFKVNYFGDRPPEYVEVKGFPTRDWKQKFDVLKLVKDEILEPGAKIILQEKNRRRTF